MRAESYNSLAVTALEPASGLARYAAIAFLVVAGSAVTAIAAQFRLDLPFTPVPITGQTFAVLLVGAVLGSRLGGAALMTYWTEGAIGLPVFAGGTGGWASLPAPPADTLSASSSPRSWWAGWRSAGLAAIPSRPRWRCSLATSSST